MAKGDNFQEAIQKTAKIIAEDSAEWLYDDLQDAQRTLKKNEEEIFNRYGKNGLPKLQQILIETNKTSLLVDDVLTAYNSQDTSSSNALHIAEKYLEIASNMDYIFKLIDSLIAKNKTVDDVDRIFENIVVDIGNERNVISQEVIENIKAQNLDQSIFSLRQSGGQLTLFISSIQDSYNDVINKTSFDVSASKHYEQFKQYCSEHYFGANLTGRMLYNYLGQSGVFNGQRPSFWSWWKKESGKSHMVRAGDRHFSELIQSFLNMDILSEQLKAFLEIAAANNKKDILSGQAANLNWGHFAEAYERHLEKHHALMSNGYPKDKSEVIATDYPDEPHGFNDWVAHVSRSTGRWPGVFGPDTEYSQIKQYANSGMEYELAIDKQKFLRVKDTLLVITQKVKGSQNLVEYYHKLKSTFGINKKSRKEFEKSLQDQLAK